MNKTELLDQIVARSGLTPKEAAEGLEATLASITASLQDGQEVALSGFGKFAVSQRAARQGRNPATGEPLQIAASRGVKFSAAKALKDAVR